MTEIEDRRILVTGASSGIGEAVARELTTQGARVAVLARNSEALDRLAEETGVLPFVADLRDGGAATTAVEAAADALGGLDVLINNAGTFRLGRVADGEFTDWQDMMEVNILGLLATTKAAIPHLAVSEAGQVINISSMSGRRVPGPTTGVYAGSKHAVNAISEALRAELHDQNIRVTLLSPGYVRTNFGQYITDPRVREEAARGQREQGLDPKQVAAQVVHVLSAPRDVHLIEIAFLSTRQQPS